MRYFSLKNAVFSPTCVGFSRFALYLLKLILCINDLSVRNTQGTTACGRGYRIDIDMACNLCYLTKVGRCFEAGGLLVPTIFRCAVVAGLGYVITIFTLFVVL